MNEHRGTAFYNSCVKVPVDPYSRQPTPSYDRPDFAKNNEKSDYAANERRINLARTTTDSLESSSPRDTVESFLDFLSSIPDYGQVHHLSSEQFRQKLDYLKRKQRLFLTNLQTGSSRQELLWKPDTRSGKKAVNECESATNALELRGKKCFLEQSRGCSPLLYRSGSFSPLVDEEDLMVYRYQDRSEEKESKTMRNNEIHLASKNSNAWNELIMPEADDSDTESIETKSLPPPSSRKEWHPTVPKPFSFTLREEAEKYMTRVEKQVEETSESKGKEKKSFQSKRRVRPIPLTSKMPLYEKLLADKEERSRRVREKSALNLLSQVRPFKLECDRRAWKFLARSNPELRCASKTAGSGSRNFRAKPVPRNLFGTEVYDRMLEDEYYRHLKKKIRAAELMKSSALPPSMARRERLCQARDTCNYIEPDDSNDNTFSMIIRDSSRLSSYPSDLSLLGSRGTNLAAILRCQASREKLERELRDEMEEKRREQTVKMRESLIGRKPVWRALRSAARHEHERDLVMRTSLRRDEAREQAERHRLQMEMMLDRVTQIPTLFERHSQVARNHSASVSDSCPAACKHCKTLFQNYQTLAKMQQKLCPRTTRRKSRNVTRKLNSGSVDSYSSYASISPGDSGSGSLTSSSDATHSLYRSSKSSKSSATYGSQTQGKSVLKSERLDPKKKSGDRGQLKVSINETAQLIDDRMNDKNDSASAQKSN